MDYQQYRRQLHEKREELIRDHEWFVKVDNSYELGPSLFPFVSEQTASAFIEFHTVTKPNRGYSYRLLRKDELDEFELQCVVECYM